MAMKKPTVRQSLSPLRSLNMEEKHFLESSLSFYHSYHITGQNPWVINPLLTKEKHGLCFSLLQKRTRTEEQPAYRQRVSALPIVHINSGRRGLQWSL